MSRAAPWFHGVAIDAGSGLATAIKAARGASAALDDLLRFKRAILTILGPNATTVLLDATFGPQLLPSYPPGCAPMIAYEADVYHISDADRVTVLPDNLTVADYPKMGVKQLKFFLYYAPDDDPALNVKKQSLVAQVGMECAASGVDFLMEPLVYHPFFAPGSEAFARAKPDLVARSVALFAQDRFQVAMLKVEVPVDLAFVEGYGAPTMTRRDALDAFRAAAAPARDIPLVYLSAGVPFDWFAASLAMAGEAEVPFAGFMCGRAIWADAIAIFGAQGEAALQDWLATTGRARLDHLIATVTRRRP